MGVSAEEKVAIITGAASGIGWALAQTFARARYAVCVVDLDTETAKKRAGELDGDHEGYGCDVSSVSSLETTWEILDKGPLARRMCLKVCRPSMLGRRWPGFDVLR